MKPYFDENGVTIYHGDCRDLLRDMEPGGLVLTDPPYGVTYSGNHNLGRGTAPITNDGTRLSLALYREVMPILRADHLLWFTRWDAWPDVWTILGQFYPIRGLLVWDKGHPGMGDLKHWGPSYELIASAGSGKIQGSRDESILRFNPVPPNGRRHPTEKPVAMLAYLIEKLAPARVIDPFCGSGGTLEAAKSLGVPVIGIEIEERYCEVAARRFDQGAFDFGAAA